MEGRGSVVKRERNKRAKDIILGDSQYCGPDKKKRAQGEGTFVTFLCHL